MKKGLLLVLLLFCLTGCFQYAKTPTTPELLETGGDWAVFLSQTNKMFGFIVLIGVIGGAAAVYFREARLLGVPAFSAAALFFLKFLHSAANDLLAYVCVIGAIVLILMYAARKHTALKEAIASIEPFKEQVGEGFENLANEIQSTVTKNEIKKIRKNSAEKIVKKCPK